MSTHPKILVCTRLNKEQLAVLAPAGHVDARPELNAEAIQATIGNYHALIVDGNTTVDGRTIEEGYNLRAIGCVDGRLDQIDVSAARALGVTVCHAPGSGAVASAEQTFGLLLVLGARDAGRPGLAGKTLGLVGFGEISAQVAQRALAFDMRVIINQPRLTPHLALADGATAVDLPELLRESDFVSLHVPVRPETRRVIGPEEVALMKTGSFLLSTTATTLVDTSALLDAIDRGHIAGAALADDSAAPEAIARRPELLLAPPPLQINVDRDRDVRHVLEDVVRALRRKRASETLALEVVPIDRVVPHEQIDDRRVLRLMERLEQDGRLVNPPLVTPWNGRYVVLDGATRYTSLKRLGYPHIIVQIVDPGQDGFALHTWYHVISDGRQATELYAHLAELDGLSLSPLSPDQLADVFQDGANLCYFLDREGRATVARAAPDVDRLSVLNKLVARYTAWGAVERTLLTDHHRLLGQFPELQAVAVYPQFSPTTVFDVASRGALLPAGLTRFVIPGRILRLNADLAQLKADEPLAAKRLWFNAFLEEKLARSRMRYYHEPVILLDE